MLKSSFREMKKPHKKVTAMLLVIGVMLYMTCVSFTAFGAETENTDEVYGNFNIETVFQPQKLVPNQMLTAKVTATDAQGISYEGKKDVLVIVGLYDSNNTMVNISYISKGIPYKGSEALSAGFKLPANIKGHVVRSFMWDGTDLKNSNMIPLSNEVSIKEELTPSPSIPSVTPTPTITPVVSSLSLQVGQTTEITQDEGGFAGIMWNYSIQDKNIIDFDSERLVAPPVGIADGFTSHTWVFKAKNKGSTKIIFTSRFKTIEYIVNVTDSSVSKPENLLEAEKLVREYIYKTNPGMNPEATFPLMETTTEEIYAKINAQVYKVTNESFMSGQDFIIQDGIVTVLGSYWGGRGITDMKVVDQDESGKYELVYHYVTGSGILRYMEGIYYGPGHVSEKELGRMDI